MATGDQADMLKRLHAALPPWFSDDHPNLDVLLTGSAVAFAYIYSLYEYALLQTRLANASGTFLDVISRDFFGDGLPRVSGESDAAFLARILFNLFEDKATRSGLVTVLTSITGHAPSVFEPRRPADTGAYGHYSGYGVSGGYGSMVAPYQCMVTVKRAAGAGIPNVAGYGVTTGGYSTPGRAAYANSLAMQGAVTDDSIHSTIESVKPAATTIWTSIQNS